MTRHRRGGVSGVQLTHATPTLEGVALCTPRQIGLRSTTRGRVGVLRTRSGASAAHIGPRYLGVVRPMIWGRVLSSLGPASAREGGD
ncbi:hypothetical protein NDU88_005961 [Pleurodeles waltl]|uniref:Uncharacterized protein n=1 Tax=Pleurodeles waltl TaxID=8319 RepID=A0AAV7LMM0_PLEWA|nr:hypothetical protein NDU88_005961 [Pleurodeles waltl]